MSEEIAARFWAKVNKDGPVVRPELGPCWVWIAACEAAGYGRLAVDGKARKAARVAFFLQHGRWPSMNVLHRCDNPPCVRWDHLFEGTQRENMRDCVSKGRLRPPRLHGSAHPRAKLTEEQVIAIRSKTGSHREIAARYGVSRETVSQILRGQIWKGVVL
jgi:DNA-binding CsgD family transcriptional regulator